MNRKTVADIMEHNNKHNHRHGVSMPPWSYERRSSYRRQGAISKDWRPVPKKETEESA